MPGFAAIEAVKKSRYGPETFLMDGMGTFFASIVRYAGLVYSCESLP